MDASVVIPSLVRDSLYPLLGRLLEQRFDGTFEVVVVAQPPGRIDRMRLPADRRVIVHEEPLGLGFGHYRSIGTEVSRGRVIAWIDDDESPRDDGWLEALTAPIRAGAAQVVTAGSHIPLGQGYLADSISWLGLPGGAYPGFETMWVVDDSRRTTHLCSGNFAIDRGALTAVGGFDAALTSGNEDTDLAARLRCAGIPILYEPAATVIHEARRGVLPFIRWHVGRGRAHRRYLALARIRAGQRDERVVRARLKSSLVVLRRAAATRYLPGVLFTTALQYLAQLFGYLTAGGPRARA